jgi:hypothetical protein
VTQGAGPAFASEVDVRPPALLSTRPGSLQFCVFRSCFVDHRDPGVGDFPQRKEIVVGAFRLHGVAREHERSRLLQARHGVDGIDEHDAAMIENPLELGGGLYGLMRRKVGLAANVRGIERAEEPSEADAAEGQVEAGGDLQRLKRRARIMRAQ